MENSVFEVTYFYGFICKFCKSGKIPTDYLQKRPLAMNQFKGVFSTNRIPKQNEDELKTWQNVSHIVVLCGNDIWELPAVDKHGNFFSGDYFERC